MMRWRRAAVGHESETKLSGSRETGERRRALIGSAVSLMVLLGLAPGCSSGEHSATVAAPVDEAPGTIICGTYPSTDSLGNTRLEPEYYRLWSINRTLHFFPEFASAIGMSSVKSCDEARVYMRAYASYAESHPYFDRDIPLPEMPSLDSLRKTADFKEKIFGGTPTGRAGADLFPVVRLRTIFPPGDEYFNHLVINAIPGQSTVDTCSGAFISKNLILTAAHCFQKAGLRVDPQTVQGKQWLTERDWLIDWPDANGNLPGDDEHFLPTRAITFAHPNFAGRGQAILDGTQDMTSGSSDYDLGLLWIPDLENDGVLPGDPDKSAWAVQYDSSSLASSFKNQAVYGYGPSNSQGTNSGILNSNGPPNGGPALNQVNATLVQTVTFTPWNGWHLCPTDSGGPLTRVVTTSAGSQVVIFGVNSAGTGLTCNPPKNGMSVWARPDVSKDWLLDVVRRTVSSTLFQPQILPDTSVTPTVSQSYAKYYGKPCKQDCECAGGEVCFNSLKNPISQWSPTGGGAACSTCPACDCKKGQCLPLAPMVPTAPRMCGPMQ